MNTAPSTTIAKRAPATDDTLAAFLNSPGALARLNKVATKYMQPEELVRLALMAASRNPEILQCATHSILRALMDAAAVGIAPSGMMGRGYLVPRKNNKTGELEASFDPGWRGLADIAKRSGVVRRIDAKVVYEGDMFEYVEGTEQKLRHVPNLDLPDNDEDIAEQENRRIICAYAIATFDNGEKQIEVLRKSDIERIRAVSASKSGPWGSWYDEMARKSAVRRLCKYLPYDAVLERALDMATTAETGPHQTVDMAPRRVTSTQELESRLLSERPVAAPVEKMPMSRAEAMARPAAQSAPKAASAMSAPLCGFCGLPVTDHATEYEGPEGELRAKHEDCHAFQHRGMRQPGDDT